MSEKYKFHDPEGIYFVSPTIVYWIDLFTRKEYKHIVLEALKYCQQNKGLIIYGWVIMPNHLHLIVGSKDYLMADIMRDFKKHVSREIIKQIKHINESRREWLLRGFENAGNPLKRVTTYKVWQDGNQPNQLLTNHFTQQKLDYLHHNPVEAEIVGIPEAYIYSSAREYAGQKGMIDIEIIQ